MRPRLFIGAAAVLLCACGSSAARSSSTGSGTATTTSPATSATTTTSPGSGGPAGSRPECGPGSVQTLAADRSARVYARGGEVYGCARGAARSFRLGTKSLCIRSGRAAPVALRGNLVAYGFEMCGVDTGRSEVIARRLTDGRVFLDRAATTTVAGAESYVHVTAVVIAGDGAVAWISSAGSIVSHRTTLEVHVDDKRGARRLDIGQAIVPTQLQLIGSRVRWKHGASWRSASI